MRFEIKGEIPVRARISPAAFMRRAKPGVNPEPCGAPLPDPQPSEQIAIPGAAWEKPRMRKRDHDPRKARKGRPDSGPQGRPDTHRDQRGDQRPNRRPDHRQDRREDRHEDRRPEHRAERPPRDDRPDPRHGRPVEGGEPRWRRDKFRQERPGKKPWRPPARDRDGPVILYGWHSVKAALENPARRFHRLLATENALHRLAESGITLPTAPITVDAREIEALVGPDAVHQGILAEADLLDAPAIEELEPQRLVLVLDQITDPHNVGAILRSAAAFAVEAVITTARHSPEATGVLAKAASAALEHVPLVTVPNLARALDALKDKNVFVIGLDSTGESDLATVPLRAPLALVVGAEGKGLRQLTRSHCDAVARIALPGRIKSLNVSNATALALYVASGRLASD
jgi:23S rRNA (guanosine2251-2'-O)-methyltransferase